ncbi:MAG: hypothetical protein ACFBZ8_08555 [Opitutales bacterium]
MQFPALFLLAAWVLVTSFKPRSKHSWLTTCITIETAKRMRCLYTWNAIIELVRHDWKLGAELIACILEQCVSAKELACVAAGPLEDFIRKWGEKEMA